MKPTLAAVLQQHRDGERRIPLKLCYQNAHAYGELKPAACWQVCLSEPLLQALTNLLGEHALSVGW